MGQERVLQVLKKEKLATAMEIAQRLGISDISVRKSLNQMLNTEVERIVIHVRYSRRSFVWKIINSKVSQEKLKKYQKNGS